VFLGLSVYLLTAVKSKYLQCFLNLPICKEICLDCRKYNLKGYIEIHDHGHNTFCHCYIQIFYSTVSDKFFQMTTLCSEHFVSDIEMHSEKEHHNKETYVVTLFNGYTT